MTDMPPALSCSVAVIGGGLGGVAAALAACENGQSVILTEPTDWIGGQVTAQAVSAFDEHEYIETFGGTAAYNRFRSLIRAHYQQQYGVRIDRLNPGDGWVSRLCFEPRVGLAVLYAMLAEHLQSGRLRLLLEHTPVHAIVHNRRIEEVQLQGPQGIIALRADFFLDATELGDLLPLTGAPYVTGAESIEDTGEPHASSDGAHPERVQSFTQCFLLEYRPGEAHTIPKPPGYDAWRDTQPFSLVLRTRGGGQKRFFMFGGDLPFWTYRRLFSAQVFNAPDRPFDVALINWDSNDYYGETILDRTPEDWARIMDESKALSLSFLYWLQTAAPHDDDDGCGYPGLRLLPEAVGTADGLAKYPYIREGRRLLGFTRVTEQEIIPNGDGSARALPYADSVGVGWYPIDLHRCVNDGGLKVDLPPSLPFQIPLGMLLSPALENLIAAGKCIATTHLTNGAYRLHPVEWNIGESAGALAHYCLSHHLAPRDVRESLPTLRAFQRTLLQRGIPLVWTVDLPPNAPGFEAVQMYLLDHPFSPSDHRFAQLAVEPDAPLSASHPATLRGVSEQWIQP